DVAAGLLRVFIDGAEVAHHRQGFVAPLLFHYREADGLAVDARRRAGLQAVDAERQFAQASGQGYRRRIAGAAAAVFFQADVDNGADALAVLDNQVVDGLLEDREVRLVFQGGADGGFIQHAVGLGARGTHRRALARIEDAELDAALVGGARHGAAEGINFFYQMALADAADGRVAAHLAEGLNVVRQQ